MRFQTPNFPGNWTLMWCNITNFRLTSRITLFSQIPDDNLFDSSESCQSESNWRSGRQFCALHFRGGGYEEILEISRYDPFSGMGRLPMSNVATQFSLRTKTMGSKPHRIGMMTILNNSWHFLGHVNLTQMPEFRVEEQFRDASVGNGSISNILPSIDSSSIDGRMIHSSSLRPLASLRL